MGLFLAEVVQGEGGVRVVDPAFLHAARRLCRERGILFAVDEVQTGVGRTGTFCAHEAVRDPAPAIMADNRKTGVAQMCHQCDLISRHDPL